MTSREFQAATQAVIEALDRTMPGRRIGSTPPPDWASLATADLDRLAADLTAHCAAWSGPGADLGLSSVTAFAARHGLPADAGYLRAFRKEAVCRRMGRQTFFQQSAI